MLTSSIDLDTTTEPAARLLEELFSLRSTKVFMLGRPVAIYCVDITGFDLQLSRIEDYLPESEISRYWSYSCLRSAKLFAAGRVLVRRVAASLITINPKLVQIEFGRKGKPYIHNISFNLSHSGSILVGAFGSEIDIGIDVEEHNVDIDIESILSFLPRECWPFIMNEEQESCRILNFYDRWTYHEAWIKMLGLSASDMREPMRCEMGACKLSFGSRNYSGYLCLKALQPSTNARSSSIQAYSLDRE